MNANGTAIGERAISIVKKTVKTTLFSRIFLSHHLLARMLRQTKYAIAFEKL
jgi:hypothetical protein